MDAHKQQGVTAKIEEILVHADCVTLQCSAPELRDSGFKVRTCRGLGRLGRVGVQRTLAEGFAIDFSIERKRKRLHSDKKRWDHMLWKAGGNKLTQLPLAERRAGFWNEICD